MSLWPWPLTLEITAIVGPRLGTLSEYQLQILVIRLFVFDLWAIGPTRLRLITWLWDLDLWPLRSWRLWLMRVVVLHPCTELEVLRPCHSQDMAHDVCRCVMTLHRLHRCQFSERNWKLTYFSNLIRTLFCSLLWFFLSPSWSLKLFLLLRPR